MIMNFDMDCLRTFVAVATQGGQAKAADSVGRSLPAISLQLSRLEERVGQRLFRKQGRRMILSPAGEEFLGYAKSILAANDAAVRAFTQQDISGTVRLGAIQDFADDLLPRILAEFAEQYPQTRIEVLVERSKNLLAALEANQLDQIIAFRHPTALPTESLGTRQMVWIGPKGVDFRHHETLPIVMIEGACTFREQAIESLNRAGIPWRVTLSSPSLSCIGAAVEAGLGVCVRTPEMLTDRWPRLAQAEGLPDLPAVELCHYQNPGAVSATGDRLRRFCIDRLNRA